VRREQLEHLVRAAATVLVLYGAPAAATWSIVATDVETREVGVAAASCIAGVERAGGVVPGRGVMASQGLVNPRALERGKELIAGGASPGEVVLAITAEEFDRNSFWSWRSGTRVRQYGVAVIGFEQAPAAYTGSRTFEWSGSLTAGGISVQGNLLRGPEVLQAALDAYRNAAQPGCSLSDRLLAALAAGSRAGGDRRCSRELTALSAYLEVARPEDPLGASSLRLVVTDPRPSSTSAWRFIKQRFFKEKGTVAENPVTLLAAEYEAWRRMTMAAGDCPALRLAEARQ
jgi:uncharacterized Ntn-hydrolase superfamily protein